MTTIAATTKTGHQVDIIRNPFNTINQGLFDVFIYVLIPLFIISGVLFKGFGFEGLTLGLSAFGALGILGSLYYFVIRSNQNAKLVCFCVSQQSIELKKGQSILLQFSENIKIEHIGWGTELETMLPAVRVSNGITSFTIGAMESNSIWSDVKKSVEYADYIIPNNEQWKDFLTCLSKAN